MSQFSLAFKSSPVLSPCLHRTWSKQENNRNFLAGKIVKKRVKTHHRESKKLTQQCGVENGLKRTSKFSRTV